jgi:quercetin dioxygenase-like cupin family protein
MVRRIVTEEVDGRSRIASDGPAPVLAMSPDAGIDELWINGPGEPLGHDPTIADAALTPPPGAVHWRFFVVPPDDGIDGAVGDREIDMGEVDESGWHRTDTLDYIYVLEGDITLALDDAVVELHAGDCVVQRRTNHAWRNRSTSPVRILAVMLGLEP